MLSTWFREHARPDGQADKLDSLAESCRGDGALRHADHRPACLSESDPRRSRMKILQGWCVVGCGPCLQRVRVAEMSLVVRGGATEPARRLTDNPTGCCHWNARAGGAVVEPAFPHARATHTTHQQQHQHPTVSPTPSHPEQNRRPKNNLTASKGTAHRPAERGRRHEPDDAHASPGTAATATMAGPRNAWPAQNSAGSSRPCSW